MTARKKTIVLCGIALFVLLGLLLYRGLSGKTEIERQNVPAVQSMLVTEGAVSGGEISEVEESVSGGAVTSRTNSGGVTTGGTITGDVNVSKISDQDKAKTEKSSHTSTSEKTSSGKKSESVGKSASKTSGKNRESGKKNAGTSSSSSKSTGNKVKSKTTPSGSAAPSDSKTSSDGTASSNSVPSADDKAKATEEPEVSRISFEIQCQRILNHRDLWKDGIEEIIPESGVFFSGTVAFEEGKTVYDLLKKICKENDIAMDSKYTPMYGTYYIQGIGNLYEFDCGEQSGWKYSVNGSLPNVGCSSYTVKEGDVIVFFYDYEI